MAPDLFTCLSHLHKSTSKLIQKQLFLSTVSYYDVIARNGMTLLQKMPRFYYKEYNIKSFIVKCKISSKMAMNNHEKFIYI